MLRACCWILLAPLAPEWVGAGHGAGVMRGRAESCCWRCSLAMGPNQWPPSWSLHSSGALTCNSSLNVLLGSHSGKPLQHAKLCVGPFLSISWPLSHTFPFSCHGGRAEHLYVSQPDEWQLPPPSVAIGSVDLYLSVGSCAVNPLSY